MLFLSKCSNLNNNYQLDQDVVFRKSRSFFVYFLSFLSVFMVYNFKHNNFLGIFKLLWQYVDNTSFLNISGNINVNRVVKILFYLVLAVFFTGVYIHIKAGSISFQESYDSIIMQKSIFTYIKEFKKYKNTQQKKKHFIKMLDKNFILSEKDRNEIIDLFEQIVVLKKYEKNLSTFFSGPPGNGKTEICKLFCRYLNGGYIVSLSRLFKIKSRKAIEYLNRVIMQAKKENLCLIFDDCELGLMDREMMFNAYNKESKDNQKNSTISFGVNLILSCTGSYQKMPFFFNTNKDRNTDKALSRRVNRRFFGNPKPPERKKFFQKNFVDIGLETSNEQMELLVKKSVNCKFRDLNIVINKLKQTKSIYGYVDFNHAFEELANIQNSEKSRKLEVMNNNHELIIKKLNA